MDGVEAGLHELLHAGGAGELRIEIGGHGGIGRGGELGDGGSETEGLAIPGAVGGLEAVVEAEREEGERGADFEAVAERAR